MVMQMLLFFLFSFLILVGAGFAAQMIARRPSWGALAAVWGLLAVFSGLMVVQMQAASGYDGLTQLVILMFGCLPAALGMAIGSAVGLTQRKRDRHEVT